MDARSLIVPTYSLPREGKELQDWARLFEERPDVAGRMMDALPNLRTVALECAAGLYPRAPDAAKPATPDELVYLNKGARKAFIRFNSYQVDKAQLYPLMDLDDDELSMVVEELCTRGFWIKRSFYMAFRHYRCSLSGARYKESRIPVLPLLKKQHLYKLLRMHMSPDLIRTIRKHCSEDKWDAISEAMEWCEPIAVIYASKEVCEKTVRQDPPLGQLALNNPRFEDKDEVFQMWVRRHKYSKVRWINGSPSANYLVNLPYAVCKLTGTKTGFFTKARMKALHKVMQDNDKLIVVVNPRARKKLLDAGLPVDRVIDMCQYQRRREGVDAPDYSESGTAVQQT